MIYLVDDEDRALVSAYSWYFFKHGYTTYARSTGPHGETLSMHRLILGLTVGDGVEVDHINRDGLDNRRANLRIVTRRENLLNRRVFKNNTSGYVGVAPHTDGRWRAQKCINRRLYHVGIFATPEQAVAARDAFVAPLVGALA